MKTELFIKVISVYALGMMAFYAPDFIPSSDLSGGGNCPCVTNTIKLIVSVSSYLKMKIMALKMKIMAPAYFTGVSEAELVIMN